MNIHIANLKRNNPNLNCIGKKWSTEEDEKLLRLVTGEIKNDDYSFQNLTHIFKRTVGGIKARLSLLVYKMYTSGKSINYIHEYLEMDYTFIENCIDYEEKKLVKKTGKDKDTVDRTEKIVLILLNEINNKLDKIMFNTKLKLD